MAIEGNTLFIEFVLGLIERELLTCQGRITYIPDTQEKRIKAASNHFKDQWFSRLDYMKFHKVISSATASRDLKSAVEHKSLQKTGDKNAARYQFKAGF